MFSKAIGIDLGTANVLVYVSGRGIVLNEPSVVAYSEADSRVLAVGRQAREMLGRSPDRIQVVRPMRDGVVADYTITEAMLRYFIRKVSGRLSLFRPIVMICIPAGVTNVESRAVLDATLQAGAPEAHLIAAPLAAAIGANIPIASPSGNMLVDLGGGTCEAAVLSLNDIVVSSTMRVGGNKMDELIQTYMRRKYNLLVGRHTAEEVKQQIGSAIPSPEIATMEIRGIDQVSGLPRTVSISSAEIAEALAEALAAVVSNV